MIQSYKAKSLHLANLIDAVVDVDDTLAADTIVVSVIGPEDTVKVRTEGAELHVSGPATSATTTVITGGRGVSIVSGNASVGTVIGGVHGGVIHFGSGMVVSGGGSGGEVIVNGRRINLNDMPEAPAPARVRVTVRPGTAVTVADTAIGSYRIGSTLGSLRVTGSNTTVQAGWVAGVRIRVKGTGDITIAEVTGGRLDVGVSGAGRVSIGGGQADVMSARVSGAGGIDFGGTVNGDAELEVSGVGGITVHRVTGHIDRHVSGLGRINIRHR